MTAIDAGIVVTLFGALIACYVKLNGRIDTTEDCVETELRRFKEGLDVFQREVIDRLARIETKLEEKRDAVRSK